MDSPLAQRLRRHAATIVDPATRAALFRSLLGALGNDELREAAEALAALASQGDVHARVAFLSFQVALAGDVRRQRAVLDPTTVVEETEDSAEEEPQHRVPDYGRGRPLTLGERKSLARKPDRKMFDRVLRDPHPDVIALLLQNPRLTETDVVRLCSRRPGVAEVLSRVFASRWSLRPTVRRALAMNPTTPAVVTTALLPLLVADDLRSLIDDERTPPAVARRAEELLATAVRAREVAAEVAAVVVAGVSEDEG